MAKANVDIKQELEYLLSFLIAVGVSYLVYVVIKIQYPPSKDSFAY